MDPDFELDDDLHAADDLASFPYGAESYMSASS